jgi:hypothetical protein
VAGALLKQTLLAFRGGVQLADTALLGQGDHLQISSTRRRSASLEDAAILLTVAAALSS